MLQNNKTRSKKWLLLALSAVLAISVLAGCGNKEDKSAGKATDNSKVVATYEGGQITQNEFDKEISNMLFFYPEYEQIISMDQFRDYFVKQQIAYRYLDGKAPEKAKQTGKDKAKEQIGVMKKQIGDKQFKEMLDKRKLTEDEITEYMARILTVVQDYNSKVTEDQLKAEFEKNKKDMTTASVRHILIGFKDKEGKERKKEDALKKAKDVQARLKKGEDFAKLAEQLSEDPGSAKEGGLYKDAAVGQWVPEFKEAALTLPLNQVSDPVETSYGYHVMRVENRKEKEYSKLTEEEKESLRTRAASELMNNFMQKDLDKLIKKIDLPKTETKPEEKKDEKKDEKTETPKTEAPKTESGK
ncbi:peptidylprolyl isomerase [Paenibacillus alvei]|uniref:peptidylprolyl isomerase n=1 Tax=Paenibacillus alvei TaxID=44250 RepID=UPI0018CD341E|nr:peptidylprolyl isomerase [Paenibacillus alvei]MBG9734329.1 peptidylprolyl isomerase [Paenibacillus alvei]MBG9744614.1 peptidylprolyl isomerase [Paenibacillus alvei]MCY9579807.1 peptidylprolyl isomerase [Paenibacillus alvei]MCY9588049.1 peptidylprolyl isomerase [Paenibacillus alvei]